MVFMVDNMDWIGAGKDDLGLGLAPFGITPPGASSDAGKKAAAED